MKIQLSEHFTYGKLLRFVFPSIIMMIFTSVYGVVDGIFVSNFAGKTPFSAVNLIMPFLMIFGSLGFMVGTGGSALVAVTLGEGKRERANQLFSMLVYGMILLGALLAIPGVLLLRPIAAALGAQGEMLEYCVLYGKIIMPLLPAFLLQNVFQSFFVTAEKPQLGLAMTVAAGVTNMILDALFVAGFKWGLSGAAFATAISQAVGGFAPLLYFALPNGSLLRLTRTKWDGRAIFQTCTNGSSELMTNMSLSLVNMLYNFQLMRFAGEDGVAAYGVIMYVNFIFMAVFLGYAMGSAPIVSFHYGAGNYGEMKNLLKKSLILTVWSGVGLTAAAELLAAPLSGIFVSYDSELQAMTTRGFMLYSLSFLVMGINIYGSAFFTALNNGLASACISFLRALLFQVASVMILPVFFKLDGIWLSIVAAELLALTVTALWLVKLRKRYHY